MTVLQAGSSSAAGAQLDVGRVISSPEGSLASCYLRMSVLLILLDL